MLQIHYSPYGLIKKLEKSGWLVSAGVFMVVQCGCLGQPDVYSRPGKIVQDSQQAESALGIEAQALRLSAGGYVLDFRYRAVDPERAAILLDRHIKPYLIHEATNAKFLVPAPAKIGPLRQTTNKPVAGKSYFMMFANPGQYVKAGDLVTIVFGEHRIEHLKVE